jgi:hypothetical protein
MVRRKPANAVSALLRAALLTLALASLGSGASPASAAEPVWPRLATDERRILAPLHDSWDQLDDRRKAKWREVARLYPRMTADEQARLQSQMRQWAMLTPDQRRLAREEFREHSRLAPDQQQDVLQKWKTYSNLPADQRKAIVTPADEPGASTGPAHPSPR